MALCIGRGRSRDGMSDGGNSNGDGGAVPGVRGN